MTEAYNHNLKRPSYSTEPPDLLTLGDVRNRLESTRVKKKPVANWQAEELILGDMNEYGQVRDYKFWMFQERLGLIKQVRQDPTGRRTKYYDADWAVIEVGRDADKFDASLPLPERPEELIALASEVSCSLPTAFLRVDLLVGNGRMIVGEVTPLPGRYHLFSKEISERLGLLWEMCEAVHSGRFETAPEFTVAHEVAAELAGVDRVIPD